MPARLAGIFNAVCEIDAFDWNQLQSATGGPGRNVAELLRAFVSGQTKVYDELFEQVCHQFGHGPASFAACAVLASHLHRLAPEAQIRALSLVGAVEASHLAHWRYGPQVQPQIQRLYDRALQKSLAHSTSALANSDLAEADSFALLATVAALQGHPNIAMHLFLNPNSDSLSCPECGEYINFKDELDTA